MASPNLIQPARLIIPENMEEQLPLVPPTPPAEPARFVLDRDVSFCDRGKIPQIVRDIPDFEGNPRDLSQWMLDVEDVLELFEDLKDKFQYHLVIKTIRRKIKGEANDALVTSNCPTTWENIKEVLKLYYADKRDLMTLDNQLKALTRGKAESIESYYSRVRELVTLISSAISMDDQWRGHEIIIMRLYNQIALDTFIRGLGDPLSRFCKNFRPKNLAQAYSYCVDYLNLDARNAPVNIPSWQPVPMPRNRFHERPVDIPPVPPRFNNPPKIAPRPLQNFNPRPNVFAPNRTFVQPQPKPEPMDTSSIRTQHINYGNRPFAQRRGASDSMRAHDPHAKRIANTLEVDPSEYQKWYEEQLELSKEYFNEEETLEPLEKFEESPEEQPREQPEEQQETNFLEDTEWVAKWFD